LDDEIAFRGGKRLVNRLTRIEPKTRLITNESYLWKTDAELSCPVYLTIHSGQVYLKKATRANEEDLEIAVSHFWIPTNIESRLDSESEYLGFSGRIKRSAMNTSSTVPLELGQPVLGISRTRRLSNIINVKQSEVIPKPEQMSPQQAATLPSSLTLAYHALQQATSGVKRGLVVIHEANRDLGLAGLFVARALGLSVICSSSDAKLEASKRLLKSQGALVVTDTQCTGILTNRYTLYASCPFLKPHAA
jgi:myxalamid-type polyketide synthase MxaB